MLGESSSGALQGLLPSAGTVRGAVTDPIGTAIDQLVDGAKTQAINRIAAILNVPSRHVSEGAELVGLTTTALGGAINIGAMLRLHAAMFMAGVSAMSIDARINHNIAAAHTFGCWLSDGDARRPVGMPMSLVQFRQDQDAADDDGVSSQQWGQRWTTAYSETMSALNASIDIRAARNLVQSTLGSALQPGALRNDRTVMSYTKRIIAGQFGHNYAAAAAVFFSDRIRNADRNEKRVAILCYRNTPYRP